MFTLHDLGLENTYIDTHLDVLSIRFLIHPSIHLEGEIIFVSHLAYKKVEYVTINK
jgi:hypothetical protein